MLTFTIINIYINVHTYKWYGLEVVEFPGSILDKLAFGLNSESIIISVAVCLLQQRSLFTDWWSILCKNCKPQ